MFYKLIAYLRFLKSSNNEHGVHSPFVYDFVTKCLYNPSIQTDSTQVNSDFNKLYFPKTSTLNAKKTKLLEQIVHYFNPDWLLNFKPNNHLIGGAFNSKKKGEIFKINDYLALKTNRDNLVQTGFNELSAIYEELSDTLFASEKKPFCLIFLNEDHLEQGLKEVLEVALDSFSTQSLLIIEGINQSKENEALWKEIKNLNQVRVTVDLFFWGIIFLRKGQAKQHFKIRV